PCEVVWLNSASVQYVFDRGLWQRERLSKVAQGSGIAFPLPPCMSVEMKTKWRKAPRADPHRYVLGFDGSDTRELIAFHMMIHARPNWVWATFIHEDKKNKVIDAGESFADSFGLSDNEPSERLRHLLAQNHVGVFLHYRLIGTQIDFQDPPVLGNPLIENAGDIKAKRISCISCHSYAVIDSKGGRPSLRTGVGKPEIPNTYRSLNFNFTLAVNSICKFNNNDCNQ
ncbi:MAG: hypothetical protein ABSH09_27195, partial [Bryobacteraceae bacterium]